MNFSLHSGVYHKNLGYGNVTNQLPDLGGNIQVLFEGQQNPIPIHPTELEKVPTDQNHRVIKIGDMILYTTKSYRNTICQGVVETIKPGFHPGGYKVPCIRIGIREDSTGYIKSIPNPDQCIVIDTPVIKQEK